MKFEEEKAYRRSRELDRLQPSADQQQSSSQGTGSQGPGGQGIGSSGSVSQQVRSSRSKVDQFDCPATKAEGDSKKKRPKWLLETFKEAEAAGPLSRAMRESWPPERFSSYIALRTDIIETEPSSYEEAAK